MRATQILRATVFLAMAFCLAATISSCERAGRSQINNSVAPDSLSFIVLGDWGKEGKREQQNVAEQMSVYGRKFHTRFIIVTGDNFYPNGVASVSDRHWQASFENIYYKEEHQVPWFPVLGNHDYRTNPQAQIDYSSHSPRWKMPARYYALQERITKSDSVFFVFTDTSPFLRSYHNEPMADLGKQDTTAQLEWLRQTLSSSGAKWKIVVGHHPLYSFGPHGNSEELINGFKPVFSETKTDIYLSGHDHGLQYIVRPEEQIHYLISAGGFETYMVRDNDPTSLFGCPTPGFLVMTLYPDKCNLYFVNASGDVLYQNQIKKQ